MRISIDTRRSLLYPIVVTNFHFGSFLSEYLCRHPSLETEIMRPHRIVMSQSRVSRSGRGRRLEVKDQLDSN